MQVRFGQKGTPTSTPIDHNNLLNRGTYTHAQLDSIVDEVVAARGAESSLKAYIDATVGNLTSNFMYSRQASTDGQTVFSLASTGVGYAPGTNTLQVYVNGGLQDMTAYTETDQFTVTFNSPLTSHDTVIFRVDGRSDGSNTASAAENEIVAARTNNAATPVTFADLKSRLDSMDEDTSNALTTATQALSVADSAYVKPPTGIPISDLSTQAQTDLNLAASAYQKPSTGIPKTDLASAVQTSLGKADTAYQKPSGGIPVSDLASTAQTDLNLAATAYQKPSGGIPESDLSNAVQVILNNASNAYVKPSGGIPSSDLSSAVQTDLNLAVSAYQKPSTGIPVSDLSTQAQNDLTLAASAYQKPSGGIPLSDLADAVGSKNWRESVSTSSALPASGNNDGDVRMALDTSIFYRWNASSNAWSAAAGGVSSGGGSGGGTTVNTTTTVLGGVDVNEVVNLIKTNFRQAELRNTSRYTWNNFTIDAFNDSTGIDSSVSSGYSVQDGQVAFLSNACVNGTPISSGDGTNNGVSHPKTDAFDGDTTTYWQSAQTNISGNAWIGYDFGVGVSQLVKSVYLYQAVNADAVTSVKIQYSNDSTTWTTVATVSVVPNLNNIDLSSNTVSARYWRVLANSGVGTSGWSWNVQELQFQVLGAGTFITTPSTAFTNPTRLIVEAEYTGAVTFDVTLDGANWLTNVKLASFIDLSSLSGTIIKVRANIPVGGSVQSLGLAWYDPTSLPVAAGVAPEYDMMSVNYSYQYDANGNCTQEIISDTAATPNTLQTKTMTYDTNGNVLTEKTVRGSQSYTKTYTYDSNGNVTSVTVRPS